MNHMMKTSESKYILVIMITTRRAKSSNQVMSSSVHEIENSKSQHNKNLHVTLEIMS